MNFTPLAMLSVFTTLALPYRTLASVEIDLASTAADLSIWGSERSSLATRLGLSVATGDLNGDGVEDLAFEEANWVNPSPSPLPRGRVCVYFGPFVLPASLTPRTSPPPVCMTGTNDACVKQGPDEIKIRDVDGDGIGDLLVAVTQNTAERTAISIFRGRTVWPPSLLIRDHDWTFVAAERGDDLSNFTVGDLNGDGAADLALFAPGASGPSNAREFAGEGYVFFGPASRWARIVDLAVDAPDVHILGADGRDDNPRPPWPDGPAGDELGLFSRCWTGNLLGDDIADLVFAGFGAAGPGNARREGGELYVLRGRTTWPAEIDLRFTSPDLLVYGPFEESHVGYAAIGDWDGDSRADLLVGAETVPVGVTRDGAGTVYVLRGGAGLGGVRDLARPADASSRIIGPRAESLFGYQLALADVDGDGYPDLVSAGFLDPTPFGRFRAGAILVISGCAGIEWSRDLSIKPAELAIYAEAGDLLGSSLEAADVDRDGRADIFVGAELGDGEGNAYPDAGEAHLILGRELRPPVCTIAPDPGAGAAFCGTAVDVTLDGSATTVVGCSLSPQYRWMAGSRAVRDWSTDPTVVVRPSVTTTYRLEIRCGDCLGPCFSSAEVLVTVYPDVTPPNLANTLLAVRSSATDVTLSWTGVSEAKSYAIYRSLARRSWDPIAYLTAIAGTAITLPDLASPPQIYYRAVGASCSGSEGP